MTRGEVGVRPLILDMIKRVLYYTKSIKERKLSTVHAAFQFENANREVPNFTKFISKIFPSQNDVECLSRSDTRKRLNDLYDRHWWSKLLDSPKAICYASIKNTVFLEKYLYTIDNSKHRTALSRFRLSNHDLLIEKGRHMRPRLERNDRKCFVCNDKIENESHFLTECPLYENERNSLYQACRENCVNFDLLNTNEQRFCFIMTNENPHVIKELGKFIFHAFKVRQLKITPLENQ